jgi:hypothetical protein
MIGGLAHARSVGLAERFTWPAACEREIVATGRTAAFSGISIEVGSVDAISAIVLRQRGL